MFRFLLFTFVALTLTFATTAFAENVTVDVFGESQIIDGDLASAKVEAESRARWAAMEEASQIKVSVSSIVYNATLLDESIKSQLSASIVSYKKLDEGVDGDAYWVQAQVVVAPDKGLDTLSGLAPVSKIAVYIPLVADGDAIYNHPFSEELIARLMEAGFDVVDISSELTLAETNRLTNALDKRDMSAVQDILTQFMAGSLLIGKLQVVDKGRNVGYATVNFSIVDGQLDYRIIGNKDGGKVILNSGTLAGRGQGMTLTQAAYSVSTNMAKRDSNQIVNNATKTLLGGSNQTIAIVYLGNRSITKLNALQDDLQNTSWVLNVKERGIDRIFVDYPEKAFYLATILAKKGYSIKSFDNYEIIINAN